MEIELPSEEERRAATAAPLADDTFREARDFLRTKLTEAMEHGHLKPEVATDIFKTFCGHFASVLTIASGTGFSADQATAANAMQTILLAAYAAGSRDPNYISRLKQAEGKAKAAVARRKKSENAASGKIDSFIQSAAEAEWQGTIKATAERIEQRVNDYAKELRRAGHRDAATFKVSAIEKRIGRLRQKKTRDG